MDAFIWWNSRIASILGLVMQEKAKEFGKQKMAENINAEEYLAESGEKPLKKKKLKNKFKHTSF